MITYCFSFPPPTGFPTLFSAQKQQCSLSELNILSTWLKFGSYKKTEPYKDMHVSASIVTGVTNPAYNNIRQWKFNNKKKLNMQSIFMYINVINDGKYIRVTILWHLDSQGDVFSGYEYDNNIIGVIR